ncbi:hypothetical protein Ade02nite_95810 [Paractinoplanes deccanensis]|uniref:ATPase dynein-related AAA domain-containing protein n=1 Tax=Paractinoplanes deccanensis TaxID=113561 RepID=A0ABQ3YMA6_9ACTN|nr:AAA family ATPase [Actinoplanes deccanensis]GID80940.1 hypothetical protein Ade02nite_95810 [Actinoplanes deccanensis]
MARGKPKRQTNQRRSATPPRQPRAKTDQLAAEQVAALFADAQAELGPDDVSDSTVVDSEPDPIELAEQLRQAVAVRRAYQEASARLRRRETELEERAAKVDESTLKLGEWEARLVNDRAALASRIEAIDERDRRLLEDENALRARQERDKEELIADARAELSAARSRFDAARRELDDELTRQRERLQEELARERAALDEDRAAVRAERQRLRRWEGELQIREEDLQDVRELYDDRTKLAVTAATEDMRLQADHLRRLYEAARDDAERQGRQIAEFERLRRAMDDRDPDEVRDEIDRLRADSAELKRLRLTAPAEKELQLSALEEEARRLRDRCVVYAADNERLQRQLSAHQITATALERMAVGKEALEAEVRAYRDMIEEEERKWQGLVARREGTSPLPMCTEMDAIHADRPSDLAEDVPPLPELVSRVRALIRQQHHLFYEEVDLRSFLAGLATSQLHLLQGISGIGKTQLPQRFAEAIGAGSAVVSVGADWRTPQDLMGYYNAFERRFYESEFTKALYRAQCPAFADQPYFIVLDEMNLSHPEQYFNDVLSALERDVNRTATPDLVLMSAAVSPSPRLLREGRLLPVPRSAFFVGTANHDETTVSFADKTYDRAHVIELPTSPHPFDVPPQEPLPPLSFQALTHAFNAAEAKHRDAAADARTFLTNQLAGRLADDFRISWGSRLNKHIARYVPVVVAAGGTVGEATDHLIATKILRKLHGRYEIRADELKKLRDDLESRWSRLPGSDMPPMRSRSVIEALIRDLGQA